MLIFGASAGDWREKAAYAQDKADNELAEIRDIRCEGIEDAPTALAFMAALAADTKCKEFIYHATINLFHGERLSGEQWLQAIDTLEKNLGLEGHYRIAFEHIKKDRQHYHIYWSRLPPAGIGGPAVNMGNDYFIHQNTAKALEKEFGLKPAPRRDKNKPSLKKEEINERNGKTHVDPDIVTKDVTRIFHESKAPKNFIENLSQHGYTLTRGKGDKLVLVDSKGGWHGLMRRIEGVNIAGLRQKFPELEKMALPSLNEVLRNRRPPSAQSFRKAAKSFSRSRAKQRTKPQRSGRNPYLRTPLMRSVASIMAEARARSPKGEKKYYPAPIMRKRRKSPVEKKFTPRPEIPDEETSNGRADAAYQEEFGKWEGLIEAAAIDPGLSKDQRLSAVASLRWRQQQAAIGARKRVLEEEQSIARAARRAKKMLLGIPDPEPHN